MKNNSNIVNNTENKAENKMKPVPLALSIAVPLIIGGASAIITGDMMKDFFFMNKPPLAPPGWVFPVVWTILYVMMGLAFYLVVDSGKDWALVVKSIIFYFVQLMLNFFWPILFFKGSLYLWAFIELLAMLTTIIITTVLFFKTSKHAGLLMIPYIVWTSFAAYLNIAVYVLSITPMILPR